MQNKEVFWLVLLVAALTSPSSFAAGPAPTSWVLKDCPVNPVPAARAFGVDDLISFGVGAIVDWVGGAITKAAEVDREGVFVSGTTPSYLHYYTPAKPEDTANQLPASLERIDPLGCVVVAIADSSAEDWCKTDNPLKEEICSDPTMPLFKPFQLLVDDRFDKENSSPTLYAEIALIASNDNLAVLPQLRTLYYPQGIPGSKKKKRNRDLVLKISGASASGSQSLGTITLHVADIKPSNEVQKRIDGAKTPWKFKSTSNWVTVAGMPKAYLKPKVEQYVLPTNVTTEVRELGNPNKFLQALAKAISKSKDEITAELNKQLVPGVAEAAEADSAIKSNVGKAAYHNAIATVFKAESAFATACASNATEPVKISAVKQQLYAVLAAHRLAEVESLKAKIPPSELISLSTSVYSDATSKATSQEMCSLGV